MRPLAILILSIFLTFSVSVNANSGGYEMKDGKTAIVVAAFGTTYDRTLPAILNIAEDLEKEFPDIAVRLAFTSNIIRAKWHKRRNDDAYRKAHQEVPEYLYHVKNVLGTMADLQNEGYRHIVVQSTHVAAGEEFHDLMAYVHGLRSIRTMKYKYQPFLSIGLGKPLTGTTSHQKQLKAVVKALEGDVEKAKKTNSALVYMGHGNEHMAQGIYYELELAMNRTYGIPVFIGLVEGQPDLQTVQDKLKHSGKKKVLLKPLMIVAGDHAANDMAGDEEDAWKVVLSKDGYDVTPILEGLGDNPKIRRIFIQAAAEAAEQANIQLK